MSLNIVLLVGIVYCNYCQNIRSYPFVLFRFAAVVALVDSQLGLVQFDSQLALISSAVAAALIDL